MPGPKRRTEPGCAGLLFPASTQFADRGLRSVSADMPISLARILPAYVQSSTPSAGFVDRRSVMNIPVLRLFYQTAAVDAAFGRITGWSKQSCPMAKPLTISVMNIRGAEPDAGASRRRGRACGCLPDRLATSCEPVVSPCSIPLARPGVALPLNLRHGALSVEFCP